MSQSAKCVFEIFFNHDNTLTGHPTHVLAESAEQAVAYASKLPPGAGHEVTVVTSLRVIARDVHLL